MHLIFMPLLAAGALATASTHDVTSRSRCSASVEGYPKTALYTCKQRFELHEVIASVAKPGCHGPRHFFAEHGYYVESPGYYNDLQNWPHHRKIRLQDDSLSGKRRLLVIGHTRGGRRLVLRNRSVFGLRVRWDIRCPTGY